MGRCGGYAKTVSTVVPGVEGRDPASFAGTPGVNERLQPNTAGQGGDGDKAAYPFLAAAALGHGTLTYGRALMGRASRENISCRGLRWDIFPLRSDYGSTSMAWVGLLKWAIYIWHSLLQV